MKNKFIPLILLIAGILVIFIGRTWLATKLAMPRTFEIFDTLTATGALIVLLKGYTNLKGRDWVFALVLGAVVGVGMLFATLFSPYPILGVVKSNLGQALARAGLTIVATLGGLVIMHLDGPVQFHTALGHWQKSGREILLGLAIGLPLAVLNVVALQFTQGRPIQWQSPQAAALDALQPGIVEEFIYRFALWGLLWLVLRKSQPQQAAWLAGLLALLVHNYAHFDDLFLQAPWVALGMGVALALIWGLPPLLLAHYRGLEAAIAFHWLQDFARFLAGF